MAVFNPIAYYRNISRLARNTHAIPRQIASKVNKPGEAMALPLGTAAKYFTTATNSLSNYVQHYGNHTRLARYGDYQQMETMAEIASALDIYAHETCAKGLHGEILQIESDDPKKKDALVRLFYDTLNIEFNAASWVRALCKYGDFFLLLDHHPDFGIMNAFPLPVNEIQREENYNPKDPGEHRFVWANNQQAPIESWQVIHFRMTGNDNFLPYGMSVLEAARRVWRQLILMEDAVMVYRIVRSAERRVFYLDIGNVAPNDVPALMNQMRDNFKRNQVVDPNTGQVDLRYNALSVEDDYFIAVRGQDNATRIETLPGGQFVGDIDDLQYLQNKLFAALKVPKSYLGYEGDLGAKASLSQQDVRFARTIQHIQRIFLAELEKMAMIQLFSMGYRDDDCKDFSLSMANPSSINEIQRLELWRSRFEVASLATSQEGFLDRSFIYKQLLGMNDAEIEAIAEGRRKDKLEQLEIDGMQLPMAGGDGTGEAGLGGAQGTGLPTEPQDNPEAVDDGSVTNNAQAPMDNNVDQAAAAPAPTGEARDPNVQRAIPNDLKGKQKPKPRKRDSEKAMVYRTKKNGLDYRHELGQMRRAVTAPFAESETPAFIKQQRLLNKHSEVLKMANELTRKSKKVL